MSSKKKPPLETLEAALGHVFADRSLLERALTHISFLDGPARLASYQRLEFLGDRVLGLAVADMLYRVFPDDEEGAMSRRLSDLVRKETCAAVAIDWGVGPHVKLGLGEAHSGGRKRVTTLGDVCEALIGGVFVDAGYEKARAVVEKAWRERLHAPVRPPSDAKTALQEWAQGRALKAPTYRLVSRTGPDHNPRFVIAVDIETLISAEGEGKSKRLAEQAAASAFMAREGISLEGWRS
ncbi:ribonuclease III [Labrys sp. KNU-23]|uniref:ribonuclease III n=1 Tax=Labrys sp. KNU-23 TaxID=2789216 RepID=UPI0011EED7E7|nr:ribonuclease III [Labrys sp. KNU-23]QEN90509.1 ribonuclease III [Labrys sp. KNU-23]